MSAHFRGFLSRFCRRAVSTRISPIASSVALEVLETRALPSASVLVLPQAGLFTTEAGGTAHFSVVLTEAPTLGKKTSTVQVPIQSSNTHEGTVNFNSLIFTSQNWKVPQEVTVTGVDDHVVDGNQKYQIELGKLVTQAKNYKRINPADLSLINKDNDGTPAAIVINPGALIVNDAASRNISLRLAAQPAANVDVEFQVIQGADQARLSTSKLTFTPANWNLAQTLTVGAFNDEIHDGDQPFMFTIDAMSKDTEYDQLPIETFTATIHDIDPLTASLNGTFQGSFSGDHYVGGSFTPISGEVAFSVSGTSVTVTSPSAGQGTVTGDKITFSDASGAIYTGAFTERPDGSVTASGTWQILQNGAPAGSGTWTTTDGQHVTAGLHISPTGAIGLNEGSQQDISISLLSQPTANVQVTLDVIAGADQASLSTTTLTFTSDNWFTPQTVTITGIANDGADGDQIFQFTTTASSSDTNYSNVSPQTITATIHDTQTSAATLDGNYTGPFTGLATPGGQLDGQIAFSVAGDVVNVTQPTTATGTITGNSVNFSPTSGQLKGAVFTGTFVQNTDGTVTASGNWSLTSALTHASGTWNATRPAVLG
ncbi:MAG: hypothetical protein JWM11_1104 [Planctomycetaceae bacterium]|nr:hypothetical protein [Planctomycetaceae bacterium]